MGWGGGRGGAGDALDADLKMWRGEGGGGGKWSSPSPVVGEKSSL